MVLTGLLCFHRHLPPERRVTHTAFSGVATILIIIAAVAFAFVIAFAIAFAFRLLSVVIIALRFHLLHSS